MNRLLATPASTQWQHIEIRNHHGIVVPLFSLHSLTSCGIGEYPDLIPLIGWCKEVGFDVIQLLPLNDTGLETSPYSALSANALNPIHIGLTQLPYWERNPDLKNQVQELQIHTQTTKRIDYKLIQQKRESFLKTYYLEFGSLISSQEDYQTFKNQQDFWLKDYRIFKALKFSQQGKNWENWPLDYRIPSSTFLQDLLKDLKNEMEYQTFLQFLCFQQFKSVKGFATEKLVHLKGDLPILINRDSVDVWRYPHQFILDYAAGAPPDMYAKEGQKWGFPLYNWDVLAAEGYRWWIERLHIASQFYHLYRIDHIVGFFRIWAIPLESAAKEGHFIPAQENQWIPQGEVIMRVMLANCSMLPIGEDLGLVPTEIKELLKDLGICGTKVMRWERDWHGDLRFINPKNYPQESMTTVSTHDSETVQLWWRNHPEEAGLYAQSMGWEYYPDLSPDHRYAILEASHQSGSLFHINLLQEYLALFPHLIWPNPEDERINIPGTVSDKNWTYRFRPSIEEIVQNQELKGIIQRLLAPLNRPKV